MERLRRYAPHLLAVLVIVTAMFPGGTAAMHIMEGYLPPMWCIVWFIVAAPFVIVGTVKLVKVAQTDPQTRMLLALVAAFAFVLSALKIPSVTGSCSHPCGVALGSVIFGPWVMAIIGMVVLVFQAILLAHGGLTTLGANTFSMAIAGPFVAYAIYWLIARKAKGNVDLAVFLAAFVGSLFTYVITSGELALAFPDSSSGFMGAFLEFATIFAVTQVPLSIIEGLVSMLIFRYLRTYAGSTLIKLGSIDADDPVASQAREAGLGLEGRA